MKLKVSSKELLDFTKYMSSLLNSGLSVQESIEICGKIISSKKLKLICDELSEKIYRGNTLSEALKNSNGQFDSFYTGLVMVGEESGQVKDVFVQLVSYLEGKKERKENIVQAVIYPAIVILTAVFVIGIILFFVFPKMTEIFEILGEQAFPIQEKLHLAKKVIFNFIIAAGFFCTGGVLFFNIARHSTGTKLLIDEMVFQLPFVRKFFQILYVYEICFSMKLLTCSGVNVCDGLVKSEAVIRNSFFKKEINELVQELKRGNCFSEAVQRKIFPVYFQSWIKLAERTGKIGTAFDQLENYYREEIKQITKKISVSIEPSLIFITGVFVFVIVAQFVLPVFNLLGGI